MDDKEQIILFSAAVGLSIICFAVAILVLPQNCTLFGSNIPGPFMCDGIDLSNPQPCPICNAQATALVAQSIGILGLILLALPIVVSHLRGALSRKSEAISVLVDQKIGTKIDKMS
jgi:hypothetical protein